MIKLCPGCKEKKPLEEFHANQRARDKVQTYCKLCQLEYNRANKHGKVSRDKNPEGGKNRRLKSRYGITLVEFNDLLIKQNHRCAICKCDGSNWHVDHCHESREVRGILCMTCNIGLGHFKDDTKLLDAAIEYLKDE